MIGSISTRTHGRHETNSPTKPVDLVVTSPPYDNLRTYNGSKRLERINVAMVISDVQSCKAWRRCRVGLLLTPPSRKRNRTSLKQVIMQKRLVSTHDTMIWSKDTSPFPSNGRYIQTFEYMFVFSKRDSLPHSTPISDRRNKLAGTKLERIETRMEQPIGIPGKESRMEPGLMFGVCRVKRKQKQAIQPFTRKACTI